MKLKYGNTQGEHEFVQVPLLFEGNPYQNAFGQKNNKTVAETLAHHRYAKFERDILRKYPDALKKPLGSFLLGLKKLGDGFYKRFLNKYGDLRYSIFKISEEYTTWLTFFFTCPVFRCRYSPLGEKYVRLQIVMEILDRVTFAIIDVKWYRNKRKER